jgi:hypothetical protein
MKKAMEDLGIPMHECVRKDKSAFEKKGLDPDVAELRYKHHLARLIDTLNKLLEQRRVIKMKSRLLRLQETGEMSSLSAGNTQ